VIQSN